MENRKTKIISASAIAAVIILAVCVFFWFPFHSSTAFQFSLVRFTNDVAVFRATNESSDEISFLPYTPQTKLHGDWSRLIWPVGARMTNLPAHASCTFTVATITNGETWREPCGWSYNESYPIENFRAAVKANLQNNWEDIYSGRKPMFYNAQYIEGHTDFSSEITNRLIK